MTIRNCLAKLIPALCLISTALVGAVTSPSDLATLARAYRESPTPAHRAALESYAAAHAKQDTGWLARLALGVTAYEQKDYTAAVAALQPMQLKLPQIADYTAYYLAAARVEANDATALAGDVAKDLVSVHSSPSPSPLAGRAWLLEARA